MEIILFILLIAFSIYLPGVLFFHRVPLNVNVLSLAGPEMILGIIVFTFLSLILKFLGISLFFMYIFVFIVFLYFFNHFRVRRKKGKNFGQIIVKKNILYILFFILLLSLLQSCVIMKSGHKSETGLVFTSVHDNLWNIAVIEEISKDFPPQNPAMSGFILKNHHYLYHLFLSSFRQISGIEIMDLYFKYAPFMISVIFGLTIYSVVSIFTSKNFFQISAIFFGYFSGNLAHLASFVFKKQYNWSGNMFMSDQPFDQIFNPYSVLGFSIMLAVAFCLYTVLKLKTRRNIFRLVIAVSLMAGASYGYKSFSAVLILPALFISIAFLSFDRKRHILLTIFPITLVLFLTLFFMMTEIGNIGLKFQPFWILTELFVGKDKLNIPGIVDIENYYKSTNNILGYVKIRLFEFLVYLIGNLGSRFIGLITMLIIGWNALNKKSKSIYVVVFLGIITVLSFIIPIVFNLGASAHNIVQFTPYSLLILSVFTGLGSGIIFERIGSKNIVFALFFVLILSYLSFPVNIKNFYNKLKPLSDNIHNQEVEALQFLSKKKEDDGLVLIDPKQSKLDSIYVPALSKKRVYLASPDLAKQTGLLPQKRQEKITKFFSQTLDKNFLKKNNISYIYLRDLDDIYQRRFYQPLFSATKSGNLQMIYQNRKAVILRL